jgi:ATP/maltotriose-dependent transcriptional regulator MalT
MADRVRLNWLREGYLGTGWSGDEQLVTFAAAVDELREQGYQDVALNLVHSRSVRFYWSNHGQAALALLARTVDRLGVDENDSRLVALRSSLATVQRGADLVQRLNTLLPRTDHTPVQLFELAIAASAIGAFDLCLDYVEPAIDGLRARGDLGLLAQTLACQGYIAAQLGEPSRALVAASECRALALETSQPRWALVADIYRAQALAQRGETATASRLANECEAILISAGAHPMLALVQLVRGTAALADGRHSEAYGELHRVFDSNELAYHPFTQFPALELIAEAAVHSGRHDELATIVAALEPAWEVGRSPALGHSLTYARALLAPDDDADRLFGAALAADLTRWPFHRARRELAYGAWLRRHRRPAESRPHLRAAALGFDALGVTPWAQRARQELNASGETLRRPDDRRDQLTPQELQVAQLAARGLSNNEIAELLFISPRTVSTHIYRIFPKLVIGSRAELATALQTPWA